MQTGQQNFSVKGWKGKTSMEKEDEAKSNAGTQNVCRKLVGSAHERLQFCD